DPCDPKRTGVAVNEAADGTAERVASAELGPATSAIHAVAPTVPTLSVAALNIHLVSAWKRQQFLKVVCGIDGTDGAGLDVCGIVESWLRDSNNMMNLELRNSQWCWYGKDRRRMRGGGLGILAKKY